MAATFNQFPANFRFSEALFRSLGQGKRWGGGGEELDSLTYTERKVPVSASYNINIRHF